jgi:hypothetical protein
MDRLLGKTLHFENPALGGVIMAAPDGMKNGFLKLIGRAITVKKEPGKSPKWKVESGMYG